MLTPRLMARRAARPMLLAALLAMPLVLLANPVALWPQAPAPAAPPPASIVQTVHQAVPFGLAGWVVWNWYPIELVAERFLLVAWPQLSAIAFALASLAPAALTVMALALGYPLLASE